jgi:hypothetical protein
VAPVTARPLVTPGIAKHVLWHFGQKAGVQPGRFMQLLLEAIAIADEDNERLLKASYPGLVFAVRMAQRETYGVIRLAEIAAGGEQ